VAAIVARHGGSLMRVALHWSLCHDDALDAYQRALEIYLRRLESLDPTTEDSWLRVVVKNEALAVRRQRLEAVPVEAIEADGRTAEAQRPVDDLLAGRERVRCSAEALRRIKPDEAKALVLKAQGLSYREIAETLQWSYTKVNRCISEGRPHFLKVYAEIEAGAECERFAPTLAALVDGSANADALLELRPHIRHCPACRATVRDLHATRLRRLAALFPIPASVAPLRWASERLRGGRVTAQAAGLREHLGDGATRLKQHAVATYWRTVDPTPLAGVRPGAAGAVLAGCLAIGGGATYCAEQGVAPIAGLTGVVAPTHHVKHAKPLRRARAALTPAPPATEPVASTPTPTPQPPAETTPTSTPASAPTTAPDPPPVAQEEYEPVNPTGARTSTQHAASTPKKPVPAPAGGPGEFDGP
jgi:RNA polymerase sigma factor (sigma-70 family)